MPLQRHFENVNRGRAFIAIGQGGLILEAALQLQNQKLLREYYLD
jgi:hypothetical protein